MSRGVQDESLADAVAVAFSEAMITMTSSESRLGWIKRSEGTIAIFSSSHVASHNILLVFSSTAKRELVEELAVELEKTGLPFSIQLRPNLRWSMNDVASRLSLKCVSRPPCMALDDLTHLSALTVPELTVRPLDPNEAEVHWAIVSTAFAVPEDLLAIRITPEVLSMCGVRCFVGEIDSLPVATGLGVASDRFVGVFNVATLPGYRTRGYGAAIVTKILADARSTSATCGYLTATSMGQTLYRRLGFQVLENWELWVH